MDNGSLLDIHYI